MSSPLVAKLFPRDKYIVNINHYNKEQLAKADILRECGWNTNRNWLTVVNVFNLDNVLIAQGKAECSLHDQPVRRKGFLLAVSRAYENLKSK